MKKLVWGVLSTARIGMTKVIPALQQSEMIHVRGIASRELDKAQDAVESLGLDMAYGSYEAMLEDPDIDVIYNPLPNHLHVPMTLAAARAGKHVLCEKPMAMTADELDQLSEVADKVHIMEGFMVRHSLLWQEARRLLREGTIGKPQIIQAHFCYNNTDPNNIRNHVHMGGGGLMDIGCYPITAGRYFFEAEPLRAIALIARHAEYGTDTVTSGLLDFGQGRQLSFAVSTAVALAQGLSLYGDKGRINLAIPFNQPPDTPQTLSVDDGRSLTGETAVAHTVQAADQYRLMGEAFCRAVNNETPLAYGLTDARANMRIIDALFRSETSGKWEALS
ncbi:MAG: Gfo/Idh/MocA family oxidoreductase [Asticcacaulis sp.]